MSETYKAKYEALQQSYSQKTRQLMELKHRHTVVGDQEDMLKRHNQELRAELGTVREELGQRKKRVLILEAEREQHRMTIEQLALDKDALKTELNVNLETLAVLRADREACKADNAKLKEDHQDAKDHAANLAQQLTSRDMKFEEELMEKLDRIEKAVKTGPNRG